ncbi:hypothetical protein ABBQ38_008242 [Trebouxia sp. C0009 RCD-2024]
MPVSRINDDYCDCFDGSDEPGTSACSNGRFYCRNRGHQPRLVNSSFVDDGICDCCDGTDEVTGCKNTCKEAGSAERQDLVSKAKEFTAGAKTRQKYISQSQTNKAQWKLELDSVQKEIRVQQGITDKAKAAKEEAEQADKQRREAEEASKKEEEAKTGSAPQDDTLKPEDTVNTGSQTVLQGGEGSEDPLAAAMDVEDTEGDTAEGGGQREGGDQQDGDSAGSPIKAEETVDTGSQHVLKEEADKEEERDLTPDEIGRKIASQWTTDPDAAGSGESSDAEEEGVQDEESGSSSQEADDAESLAAELEAANVGAKAEIPDGVSMEVISARAAAYWDMSKDWLSGKLGGSMLGSKPSTGKGALGGDLKSLTDVFVKADGRLHELKKQQTDLEGKLGYDYGLEEAFGALVDKCYEAQVDKYTYSVCPFKDAFQKEGGSRTSLGTWAGLADDSTVMKFTEGQGCWQGPARSMTVSLTCGSLEKLMRVEEPSRCEYIATLLTPAACTPTEVQAVQDRLATLNQELEGDHSEL